MANFLDRIFGSKIEVDLVKMELEAALCFHESRVDNQLAKAVLEQPEGTLKEHFTAYLQDALRLSEDSETDVQLELALLQTYIDLYQQLLGDQLFVRLDVQCEVNKPLPAFLLFPLVSNALQQGYNSMERFPLKVKIRVYERAIHMEVSNHVNHRITSQEQTTLINHFKNRLICLYPDRHDLFFNSNSHTFKANLQIAWS